MILSCLLVGTIAIADGDIEQQELGQLVRELELVRTLAERLQLRSPSQSGQRLQFRYDVLIERLYSLETGIRKHIDLQYRQPKNHWFLDDVSGEKQAAGQ